MTDDDITSSVPIMGPEVGSPCQKEEVNNLNEGEETSSPKPKEPNVNNSDKSEEKKDIQEESKSDPDLSPESLEIKNRSMLRFNSKEESLPLDPKVVEQQQLIKTSQPKTDLESALYLEMQRKEAQIDRLTGEILKLKQFISKRKQVYKRKRKDEGAPTRALSAYNIFVQDRFSRLAKENEEALKSADSDAKLLRVPPARLVASTGNEWKELSPEERGRYEER